MDPAMIEETNRLRIAMGMKPLPTGNATSAAAQSEEPTEPTAEDNYRKVVEAEKAKRRREEKAAAVKKARDKAQRFAALSGSGLGDLGGEVDGDAKSWLKGQKKRQKEVEKAAREEAAAAEAKAKAAREREYTSEDLAGVRVGHDMSTLLDGDEQILTLRDTTVLENEDEGDELENLNLREREKLAERLELKKKKPIYDPNDFDETGEHSILAHYDEEIHGKKRKHFTLDTRGTLGDISDILEGPSGGRQKLDALSLDILKDVPASDYLDASEVKIKKPKKKKAKSTRQRPLDDDDILFPGEAAETPADQSMDIDSGAALFTKKKKVADETFEDDDGLQAALALQRKQALKKRKRTRPEDLAKQLREEGSPEPSQDEEKGGLVIDEVAEFVSALRPEEREDKPRVSKTKERKAVSEEPEREAEATAMDEDESEPENAGVEQSDANEGEGPGIGEERAIAEGMGATLSILKSRGILETHEGADLNAQLRQHELFVAERNRLLHQLDDEAKRQRELDRSTGALQRMSAREREEYSRKQNAQREFQASKMLQDMFNKKYTPNFNISYVDDYGRELNQKEAFKALSHGFHGKSSGRGKTDKMLKKIEAEKRREAQGILDASQNVGMSSATAQQQKKRREPGVRLD